MLSLKQQQTSLTSLSQLNLPRQLLLGFTLLTLLSTASGMNLIVDPNLASPGSYPSLSSAFSAFSNAHSPDPINTIILLPSCLNYHQYFPSNITIFGGTTLGISYNNTPAQVATSTAVTNQSICNSLPTVVLTGTSLIMIQNLSNFSIQGVNLQYNGATTPNYLSKIGVVSFSHFCLTNSEPSKSLNSSFTNAFVITTVTTFTMEDGIYIYDTLKMLSISAQMQIRIDSVVFVNQDIYAPYHPPPFTPVPALNMTSTNNYSINITISNIQTTSVTCNTGGNAPLQLFSITNVNSVQMSSIALSNCSVTSYYVPQNWAVIMGSKALNINNLTLKNFQISNGYSEIAFNVMFNISAVKLTTITGVVLSGVTFTYIQMMRFFYITDNAFQGNTNFYPMSLNINGWVQNNASSFTSAAYVNCTFASINNFNGLSLQNVFISQSEILNSAVFLTLNIQDPNNDTCDGFYLDLNCLYNANNYVTINNFTVVQSKIESTSSVMYFNFYGSEVIEERELILIAITSLNSTGNKFAVISQFFLIVGMMTSIEQSDVQNDTYKETGYFYWAKTINTLLISDLNVSNLTVFSESSFISAGTSGARSLILVDNYFLPWSGGIANVYAETRPFIIYNCTFSIQNITDNSLLIESANPQVIVTQSSFSVNILDTPNLIVLGNYQSIFSLDTQDYIVSSNTYIQAGGGPVIYWAFTYVEKGIFENYQTLYQIFNNTRNLFSLNDSVNPILYFISIQQNTFNTTQVQNFNSFISLANFDIPQSAVALLNNNFFNISSLNNSNLIEAVNFNQGLFAFNSLSSSNINGYFILCQSNYFQNVSFVEIVMNNTQEAGLLSIQGAYCDNIVVRDGIATNIESSWTFIDIECTSLYTQILFTNNTFQNITRVPTSGLLAAVNFISITNEQLNSSSPFITIQDIYFNNISLYDTQFATQNLYGNSLIFILSIEASAQFINATFGYILATPDAGIIGIYAPNFTLTNSVFQNLQYGSANGLLNLNVDNLVVNGCVFESNYGFQKDGAGLFKLSNSDPLNTWLNTTISNCTFSENVAPYGTILYTTTNFINLSIDNTSLVNNQVTEKGGLIYFFNGLNSNVSITATNFTQNSGYVDTYPSLKIISFDGTGGNIAAAISSCNLTIARFVEGVFISINAQTPINLSLTNVSYSAQESSNSSPSSEGVSQSSFGLFQGDNFAAQVSGLQVINVSSNQASLFEIDCNTAGKTSYNWSLVIDRSFFSNISLNEALIEIDSDGNTAGALNNLSLFIQNTNFSNISWIATTTSTTDSSVAGGIINSLTSQIGRDPASASTASAFAVTIQNCNFTNVTGTGALVFSTIESMYDSVLLVNASNFSALYSSSGSGGLFNPSTSLLSSFNSTLPPLSSANISRNSTLMISQSYFNNINAQEGCVVYWQSALRGLAILMQNNTLSSISCSQNGGVFYANYYGGASLNAVINGSQATLEHVLMITSENNIVTNVNASNGGFMCLSGESALFQVNLENSIFDMIDVSQNGGLICTSQSISQNSLTVSSSSTTPSTRLLSTQTQMGNISVTGNQLLNLTASNGGVIFDTSRNNTLNFIIESNSFDSVSASQRGGAFYVIQPVLAVANNTFTDVSAGYSGNLIYALSNDVNVSTLAQDNTISNQSNESLIALGPTNLGIEFISIIDGSILPLENVNVPPYNPTVPNLTSYSISDYLIKVTLVFWENQSPQVVFDNSQQIQLTMYFISLRDDTNIQKYTGSNCSNSTCIVAASNVILKGLAGDTILVNVTYESTSYTQFQQFNITLRACVPGEINQTDSQQCLYCKSGTYSLTPADIKCNDCPAQAAICYGGANISINQGYSRSSSSSIELLTFDCNDTGVPRCAGGQNNSCILPFTGPACIQCDSSNNYISSGKVAACNQCYDEKTLLGYAIILLLATIGYQILMVYTTYTENRSTHEQAQQDNKEAKSELKPGQFMVIFSTFNQISSTFSNLDVGTVTSLLGVTENVGNSNTKVVFSLRCLYRVAVPDDFSELKFQILLYVFSPMAKVLIAMLIQLLISLIWRDKEGFKANVRKALVRTGAIAVVLTLLEQPAIIGILCAYLTCSQLDPYVKDEYIKGYNTIQCYTDRYRSFSHVLVIPALIFWAFLVPLMILFALYQNRKRLHTSLNCRLVLGNFYSSYKKETYYWGLVIIILKIIIFVLNAILIGSDVAKAVVFIIIIHLYFILLRWRPPFLNRRLLIAEKCCCYAYMLMLTFVLFRISIAIDGLRDFLSVLILLSIAVAGAYALINFALLHLGKVREVLAALKQQKKDKKICIEMLNELKEYHSKEGDHQDNLKRRKAISLDLSERLRNTPAYEENLKELAEKAKAKQEASWMKRTLIQAFSDQNLNIDKKQNEVKDNSQNSPKLLEIHIPDEATTRRKEAFKIKTIDLDSSNRQEENQMLRENDSSPQCNRREVFKQPIEIEMYNYDDNDSPVIRNTDNKQKSFSQSDDDDVGRFAEPVSSNVIKVILPLSFEKNAISGDSPNANTSHKSHVPPHFNDDDERDDNEDGYLNSGLVADVSQKAHERSPKSDC